MLNLARSVCCKALKQSSSACGATDKTGLEHFRYFHYSLITESISTFSLYYHKLLGRETQLCITIKSMLDSLEKILLLGNSHCGSDRWVRWLENTELTSIEHSLSYLDPVLIIKDLCSEKSHTPHKICCPICELHICNTRHLISDQC